MSNPSNLGALTTTFSAPPSCETDDGTYKVLYNERGWYYYVQGPRDTRNCMPTDYVPDRTAFYSPAPNCPSGFTPACSSTLVAGTVTDTIHTCCPVQKSFTCFASTHIYSPFSWQSTLGCVSTFTGNWSATVTSIGLDSSTTVNASFTGNGGEIGAYSVQVHFQASDLITTTTSSTSSSSSSSIPPTSTQITSTDSIPTASPSPAPASTGLSAGAAAGIGVGCGVAVLGLVAAAVLLFRRKRKQRLAEAQPQQMVGPGFNGNQGHASWQVSDIETTHPIAEIPGYPIGYKPPPSEMEGWTPPR
ncbi:hypothetical protein F5Y04DRAFT_137120 [Hypomontagnella monticulosa]|nr:hypothetical protein F5Y04DRAFT_137120 [Hypomontagnella monticulosa]